MSILEELREKKRNINIEARGLALVETRDILSQYDLALENALLKLKNRAIEIKDLKHRNNKLENMYNGMCDELDRKI